MATPGFRGPWKGRIRMGLGWGEFVGLTGDNTPHSHHALQIILSTYPQPLWTAAAGWQELHGAVIGPELRHQLGSSGEPVHLLYLEPHSAPGHMVSSQLTGQLRVLDRLECEALRGTLEESKEPDRAIARALSPAVGEHAVAVGDPEIEAWISALPRTLPERLPAARCARQLGLSTSRFLHRFRAHTGLPLRPYLRWRRLLVALEQITCGTTLTDAAHAAGFADAAHFTRTFKRHFGLTPSSVVKASS